MGVALLLAAVAELAGALDTPDPSVRETAMRELIALGDDAVPDIELALAGQTDSEARARLRYVLEELRPLRLELLVRRIGDEVEWDAMLTNVTSRTIEVARPRSPSEMPRLPEMWVERHDKLRGPVPYLDLRGPGRIRGSRVQAFHSISLGPGEYAMFTGNSRIRVGSGQVRLRVAYDASSDTWTDWTSHPSLTCRDDVEPVMQGFWRGRVVSEWVELKPPVPQHRATASPDHVRPATSPD